MNLQTGLISAGDFNKLYTEGTIYPYVNNRGGITYCSRQANKYASQWDTAASGCAVVEKTGPDKYMLRDFHNRAAAIKIGIESGAISPKEQILIRVIPPGDGLQAYKKINSAAKHSSIEKFRNTDLGFGNEIAKILTLIKDKESIKTRFYQQIAYAIIDLKIKKRSEYVLTAGNHAIVVRYIDSPVEDSKEISLSGPQAKAIATAVTFWEQIRSESFSRKDTAILENIFKSAQFFGFVVYDYMFKRKLGDVADVAKAIVGNLRKVESAVKLLTVGSMSDRLETEKQLRSLLS